MKSVRTLSLKKLRQLGWDLWDTTGLKETDCPRDEYDTYLLRLVSLYRLRVSEAEAIEYITKSETVTIGVTARADARSRADSLVQAVWLYLKDLSDYDLYDWSVPLRGQFVRAVLANAGKTWTEGGDATISKLIGGTRRTCRLS
jgi:hypothetical protein